MVKCISTNLMNHSVEHGDSMVSNLIRMVHVGHESRDNLKIIETEPTTEAKCQIPCWEGSYSITNVFGFKKII